MVDPLEYCEDFNISKTASQLANLQKVQMVGIVGLTLNHSTHIQV